MALLVAVAGEDPPTLEVMAARTLLALEADESSPAILMVCLLTLLEVNGFLLMPITMVTTPLDDLELSISLLYTTSDLMALQLFLTKLIMEEAITTVPTTRPSFINKEASLVIMASLKATT